MTPERQRIVMAELDGWSHRWATLDDPVERAGLRLPNTFGPACEAWYTDDPDYPGVYAEPPRYLTDLNAVHRAVERYRTSARNQFFTSDYHRALCRVVWGCKHASIEATTAIGYVTFHALLHATAAQRVEAMLRVVGLWEESPV